MSLISRITERATTLLPTLKTIALTVVIVSPVMFGLGFYTKGQFIKAGQTDLVVDANKDLKADDDRSFGLGMKAEGKKDAYDAAVKKLEPTPTSGVTFDADSVRRLGNRIDAGKSAR